MASKTLMQRLSTVAVEVLFFVAFTVLGFSIVMAIIGPSEGRFLKSLPIAVLPSTDEETVSDGLYHAASRRRSPEIELSPVFMPSIQYWKDDIIAWTAEYDIDPNLAATVMQIESCGFPAAGSGAGAMGLFQVMPFHFEENEQPYDPPTNANRGLAYLALGLEISEGHAGLAMAGYNGGHSVINRDYDNWAYETQRYYRWGTGIYREASAGWEGSPTLLAWLDAGGRSLCDEAEAHLGIDSTGLR